MDAMITRAINAASGGHGWLDALMVDATRFGVPLMVAAVVLQWWSGLERTRVRHACLAAGLAFLLGLAINQAVLLFVHRTRPYDSGVSHLIVSASPDWSFPSDHATASVAIAAALLLLGMRRRGLALLTAALLICVSRIYVGTHYASDALGGAATGILAALIVRFAYRQGTRLDRAATAIL
jgi:undecaprenyl-diphosphatase